MLLIGVDVAVPVAFLIFFFIFQLFFFSNPSVCCFRQSSYAWFPPLGSQQMFVYFSSCVYNLLTSSCTESNARDLSATFPLENVAHSMQDDGDGFPFVWFFFQNVDTLLELTRTRQLSLFVF